MMIPERPARLVSALNPLLAYILGGGLILLGLHAFIRPRQEYKRFGLPLEHAQPNAKTEKHSPLMFLKGTREVTYGLALVALQYQGNVGAVTAFVVVLALAGLADGFVVWLHGGQELKRKALGHWFAFVVLGSWAAWRAHQVWEDSDERKWPDGPYHIWSS
ncbi:hypothetical protein J7T55_001610 [Diaporthe amygdali]|uniref:uncharacterized protein n=1 Tax=Phomopsis amygdali TaxID=1214568 RepID=UPI0022FF2B72|nr:uncharacterized protein J7T55_001610 [Diaporthe amygdali]KAJ0115200.1 hypothetical protein J7T55_001610 [Diaporthe amygdali]